PWDGHAPASSYAGPAPPYAGLPPGAGRTAVKQRGARAMLWYCRFTWYPGTTARRVRERVVQQHAAGTNHPEKIRDWYNLVVGAEEFGIPVPDVGDTLNEGLPGDLEP